MTDDIKNLSDIEKDFDNHVQKLNKQIEHINIKQHEINSMIATIQAATNNVESLLAQEKDSKQKGKFYTTIARNIQLMNELYGTFQSFESVKHKYYQDMGKMSVMKNRMLEIEIRQIDLKFNTIKSDDVVGLMSELKEMLKSIDKKEYKQLSLKNPDYSME